MRRAKGLALGLFASFCFVSCQPAGPQLLLFADDYYEQMLPESLGSRVEIQNREKSFKRKETTQYLLGLPKTMNAARTAASQSGIPWRVLDPRIREGDSLSTAAKALLATELAAAAAHGFTSILLLSGREDDLVGSDWQSLGADQIFFGVLGDWAADLQSSLIAGEALFLLVPDPELFGQIYSRVEQGRELPFAKLRFAGGEAWFAAQFDSRIHISFTAEFEQLSRDSFHEKLRSAANGQVIRIGSTHATRVQDRVFQ